MLTPRIHSFLCRISNLTVAVIFFFHFYHNQTSSTNYGVIVSAPNFCLVLTRSRQHAFFLQSDWFICWSAFLMFDQRNTFRFGLKKTTNKQTKATPFCQKHDIQLKQLAAYLWFQGINSRKKGNLCSGQSDHEVKANLRLILFKISIKCEGEKEYWLGINHDALFLQTGRETFSTPSTFVWILRLSSNFIIYGALFLSFSLTKLGEKKDAVVVVL